MGVRKVPKGARRNCLWHVWGPVENPTFKKARSAILAPAARQVPYSGRVKRLALLLPLALAACGHVVVPPGALPPLRESALGETLVFSGTAQNWTAGQTAQVRFEQMMVGSVRADGTFSVSIQVSPSYLTEPEPLLLPTPAGGEERACSLQTISVSDAGARTYRLDSFLLVAGAAQSLAPQTSPAVPAPLLLREQGDTRVVLVYADRDVRVSGQKSCTGKFWPWNASSATWAQGSSINVFLRRGWNTVALTQKYLGENKWQLVVQGGDTEPATPWQYNGVPLLGGGT